ncbi:XdhC family protein [Metabacillus sp. RGM 3146]|uniref:XdhC family protein n=1 Tax=Metabacillus sp. RGM 3146 TaxID=3401092 RepID=UPI003B9D6239
MLPIYNELQRCEKFGIRGVLGTIIQTQGSTYQKPGTKCFISEDGKLTGLLSGGCVESDLGEHAKELLQQSNCKRLYYDFRDNGDDLWGLGLGCNGSMEIFLEPFDPKEMPMKAELMKKAVHLALTQFTVTATIVDAENQEIIGQKWILSPGIEDNIPAQLEQEYETNQLTGTQGLSTIIYNGQPVKVFFDAVSPNPHLMIFGAGPDAVPLVNGAKLLNWTVSVMDHRPGYVNKLYFPQADYLYCIPKGKEPDVTISENSFVVIMTHHFEQDQMLLKHLLDSDAAYIGILGPKKRTYQLLDTLEGNLSRKTLDRLYSPIGLDIGSKTPEEIGLSVLSEMVMIHHGGCGKSLKAVKGTDFSIYTKAGELTFQA